MSSGTVSGNYRLHSRILRYTDVVLRCLHLSSVGGGYRMGDSCLLSPPYSPHLPLRHVQRGSLQGRPLSSDSPAFPSHPIDSARLYFCDLIMHLPSALFCILYSAVYMYFDLPCSELLYIILSHPFSTPPPGTSPPFVL